MRTDLPTTRASASERLRAELARVRRRFKSRPPALRWSLGLAALAVLVALAYVSSSTPGPSVALVRSGERFAADDLIAVGKALELKHIRYQIDDRRRIEVAADQLDAANDVIAKLDIGPRPLSTIGKDLDGGLLTSIREREEHRERAKCATLEEMIRPIEGVVAAHVIVKRPRPRGFRSPQAATAFVYLETEGDRELTSATVESIQSLIAAAVPEVQRDAVSVFDRSGRQYLVASNPAHSAELKTRRHRDELRQEISDHLEMIKGVAVSVQLVAAPAVVAAVTPTPAPPPAPAPPEEISLPPTSIAVNQPLELPEEPAPILSPSPVVAEVPPPVAPASSPAQGQAAEPRAKVWIKVPRSYYLRAMSPNREPSLDDLQPFMERTRTLIETAVRHVVPPGQLDEPVVISTIPDEPPAPRISPAPPTATDSRRVAIGWGITAATIAGGLTVVFVLAARRPALRPASLSREDHGRYKIDEPSDPGPGPSERVRELIRLNPEAAASVLHRWTGQGGTLG